MSNVFVVGAAGRIGRRLCRQLSERGHAVSGLYRKPEQKEELESLGAKPVAGDLIELDEAALAELMQGSDAVVFSAGAGGAGMELTNAIDGRGLERCVAAARKAGIKRFVLVSAFPDARRGKSTSEGFENYIAVKKQAEVHLVETDLDWVVLRPGTLLEDPGTGKVRANLSLPYAPISRDDVATFIAEIIEQPAVNRTLIELTGGETPIPEAIKNLAS